MGHLLIILPHVQQYIFCPLSASGPGAGKLRGGLRCPEVLDGIGTVEEKGRMLARYMPILLSANDRCKGLKA